MSQIILGSYVSPLGLSQVLFSFCIMIASGNLNLRQDSTVQKAIAPSPESLYIQVPETGSFNSRVSFMFLFTMSFCLTYE